MFTGLLICSSSWMSYAQTDDFQFKRDIENVTVQGWYQIKLPPEVIEHTQSDFRDIRIYRINNTDTIEVPFLLKVKDDKITETTISKPVINKSNKDGKLYITLEMKKERVNHIHLDFSENNFDGLVTIEGSDNQEEWFSILEKRRILSINDQDVDFNFTSLNFPMSNYGFLRLQIEANKPLDFQSASLKKIETIPGKTSSKQLTWSARIDKKVKHTATEISFQRMSLINQIKVDITSDNDYYRPFTLEILRDSVKSEQGWLFYYDVVANGYLTSTDSSAITFQPVKTKKLRLIIRNFDNPTVNIKNIKVSGPDVVLIAKINPGENLLMYDDPRLQAPHYDLSYFENNIPLDNPVATLRDEIRLGQQTPAIQPFFEQKFWLWIAMGAIIALLGFFTIRMIKKV
ncbi:hypothetical protein BH09BAC3_BH09BAC3_34550 [soil metagenome]